MFAASYEKQGVLTIPPYLSQQLYGLFKFVTVSHTPNTSRPGLLDFAGRAKWDSWQEQGKKYSTQPDPDGAAQARYVEIAKSLGWKLGVDADDSAYVHNEDSGKVSVKGVVTGTGVSVSTMSTPKCGIDDSGTIHGLAIAGDDQTLKRMLEANPSLNINQKDEFVSVFTVSQARNRGSRSARDTLLCTWRAIEATWRLLGFW